MAAGTSVAPKPKRSIGDILYPYAYIAPGILAMCVASFVPIAFTIFIAFTSWDAYHPALANGFQFIGLTNFGDALRSFLDLPVLGILLWTVLFALLSTAINFSLGLGLAYLLNNPNMPERNVFRVILIVPWAVPGSVMMLAWSGLLNTDFGQVNALLGAFHLAKVPWLDSPGWARVAIILVNTWFGYPFMMTVCLGALQSISHEVQEAAMIDGASAWTRFTRITLPLLRSATLPLTLGTFAFNLNNFGIVYLLTGGGPTTSITGVNGATDILITYVYKLAAVSQRYGLAAAFAIFIFFFVAGMSLFNYRLTGAFKEVDR